MRSSKFYLIFILISFLSTQLMSQCLIDIEKQTTASEVCITIQIDFDIGSIEKIIISDGEENEVTCDVDSQTINWCYERKLVAEEKHIKVYALISGQLQLITPNYTHRSIDIVLVDGM